MSSVNELININLDHESIYDSRYRVQHGSWIIERINFDTEHPTMI